MIFHCLSLPAAVPPVLDAAIFHHYEMMDQKVKYQTDQYDKQPHLQVIVNLVYEFPSFDDVPVSI